MIISREILYHLVAISKIKSQEIFQFLDRSVRIVWLGEFGYGGSHKTKVEIEKYDYDNDKPK
jgi:hypothetical protein